MSDFRLSLLSDGVREVRKRPLRLQNQPLSDVWIHDQLHPQAQTPAWEIHDEQRAGELHYPAGEDSSQLRVAT